MIPDPEDFLVMIICGLGVIGTLVLVAIIATTPPTVSSINTCTDKQEALNHIEEIIGDLK